jgi:hypothetical protein
MQVSRNILMPFYRGVVLSAAISVLLPVTSAHAALGGTMAATPAGETGAPPVPILNGAVERLTTVDAGGTTINEYASSTARSSPTPGRARPCPTCRSCSAPTTPPT